MLCNASAQNVALSNHQLSTSLIIFFMHLVVQIHVGALIVQLGNSIRLIVHF